MVPWLKIKSETLVNSSFCSNSGAEVAVILWVRIDRTKG
jgi:hypothetical protein